MDGHNLSAVIRCVVPRGHPEAKHLCGDYETIAIAAGEQWEANARLIAAAPDMLAALQKIVDMNVQYAIDRYGDASEAETMSCVQVARAAISKAVRS